MEARRQFSDKSIDVLMNVQSLISDGPLKSAVFCSSSSLPPLVCEGGGLTCESNGNADLLPDHVDSKQSREAVDLLLSCHPSPSLTTFAFRSRAVKHLLVDLDPCGGTNLMGIFTLFLKRSADDVAPR